MPSTYSTNLKLQLMATGEDSGTWGVNTNNNLGTLIEESIVGADTISMVDANQTITTPDGVTGSGRKVYLNCTGVLTANRNLVVPTANKNYVVTNSTTGGFSIVVKTTAGTGITIGPGLKRYVYADGTNVVEAINSVGDLTVAGTLGISSLLTPGNATIGGNLAVTGTTALTGNATMAGTLAVTGAVTGASFNKTLITAPATSSTLAIADGKTLTVSNSITFTGTDATAMTFPGTSGTVVTLDATQTLTAKTLTSPTINTPTINTATINTATINTAQMGAASTATTQTEGDNSTKLATTAYVDATRASAARVTNSLTSDVTCNNTALYFDGPNVAQGSTGTWFASGTISIGAAQGHENYAKLWDGTTVIASARVALNAANHAVSISLSGYITNPAGNIRISLRDASGTTVIAWNGSGNEKDSTVSAFRIA